MTPWRIAVLIYIVCIQHVWVIDNYITGYVGQSVVLKPGADQPWNLTRVQWSIYTNTTYIASLKDHKVLTDRFWRYKGRLELNSKTGDLTIKDLRMNDSMIYSVVLVSLNEERKEVKVNLTVQERLKKPEIHKMLNSIQGEHCHFVLGCDSYGKDVDLTWTPSVGFDGTYISGRRSFTESILWISFSVNKSVTFNCSASSGQQIETNQITVGCTEKNQKNEVSSSCSCASMVILGILCTAVVFGLLYAFICKGKESNILQSGVHNRFSLTDMTELLTCWILS